MQSCSPTKVCHWLSGNITTTVRIKFQATNSDSDSTQAVPTTLFIADAVSHHSVDSAPLLPLLVLSLFLFGFSASSSFPFTARCHPPVPIAVPKLTCTMVATRYQETGNHGVVSEIIFVLASSAAYLCCAWSTGTGQSAEANWDMHTRRTQLCPGQYFKAA